MAEEEAKNDKDDKAADGESGGKLGKKKLIIIIAAAILLLGGGGAAYFMLAGGSSEESAEGEVDAGGEEGDTASTEGGGDAVASEGGEEVSDEENINRPPEDYKESQNDDGTPQPLSAKELGIGSTFTFEPFATNLGNPLTSRFIRMNIAFEYRGGSEQLQELEARRAQLRDAILSIISRKTAEFILSPDGKTRLRYEIKNQVNEYMVRKIDSVFISDLLIE